MLISLNFFSFFCLLFMDSEHREGAGITLEQIRLQLREALVPKFGDREATAIARLVLMTLKGWDLSTLLAKGDREASDFIKNRTREILRQLLQDIPVQYALGQTNFYGLTLKVGPGVLIPRPETEELVDLIVKENRAADLRVLDLCTGSGAIAIALARNLPFSEITAVDISPDAIAIAKENAAALKTKIRFLETDILKEESLSRIPGEFDIIVSNPPYVDESEKKDMDANVLDHEPHIALFVPDDNPLLFYKRIAEIGNQSLKAGGKLYLEINPRHAEELKQLLLSSGYDDIEIIKDINGKDRFAKAVRK